MTDPTGRSFLSYRRTRADEAALLIAAQHDRGIPTWQDLTDLQAAPTEAQLRAAIADPSTANGVLWLTSDVAASPVIRQVEAPELVRRFDRRDGFFVVPVAAGGLDYAGAASVVAGMLGLHDLRDWNLLRVIADPIGPREAAQVADLVLRQRLDALHRALPPGAPLPLALHTRAPIAFTSGTALSLDWSARFHGRETDPSTWQDVVLPALRAVVGAIEAKAPGRPVTARGLLGIPAAVALGVAFLDPRGIVLGWQQQLQAGNTQIWSLSTSPEPSGFTCEVTPADAGGDDTAVLVSVTHDLTAQEAFPAHRVTIPRVRAIVTVGRPGKLPHRLASPAEATDVALMVQQGLRQARSISGRLGTVHLFLAGPAGLAVLIGQLLNSIGRVQTYEHLAETGAYRPAALLHPSS